ncbi:dermonecrotic toxin domain-containing protein [Pseudomonas sp. PAB10]|uniref:dermonecrotic toxin domain-containing protein n=1 Tax=Pseudomonas sp. PAB10 TaxID=3233047 RepID=UPI003F994557
MSRPASPPVTAGYTHIIARAINARFSTRPTLRSVTSRLLKDGLLEKYPQLDFDPDRTKVAQPIPDGAWRLTLLLDVVLEYLASDIPPVLSEQYGRDCFLTNKAPARLTVGKSTSRVPDMQVIADVIRELPTILFIAFQESLTSYWNESVDTGSSRWQWLGDLFAGVLKTSATRLSVSNAVQADILTELADHPDQQQRLQRPWSKGVIHAYTLQTTLSKGQSAVSLQSPDILVECGETLLLCSVTGSIESFPSLDAFGLAWGARFEQDFMTDTITWKRFEPDGNIFDTQAALLLNQQLEDLASLQLPADQSLDDLEKRVDSITDVATLFNGHPARSMHLQPVQATIPEWLQTAATAERMAYRKHVLMMASVKQQTQGRSFRDDIDDIHTFAKKALHTQMLKDQPQAPAYNADELELTFHVPVGDLGSGYIEPVKMSLTELAIKNLAGKPKGRMSIRHTADQLIQDWTTEAYLLDLVSRVDVGKHYPELIENLLFAESAEAKERARLFGLELSIHLPMLALEHSIKAEHGFTRRGYRYVDAVMNPLAAERFVDDQAIVIRPLAFQRKAGADCDVVSNMFIIEPKDLNADGPHILYRPLYSPALHEYPSRQDLLSAIAQSGPLQTSVLTWLSDRARPVYDNNGFNEPHIVHFHPGDEFIRPEKPKPAILVGDEAANDWLSAMENGRLLASLFASNGRALVDLADRQSVSNAESRWSIILEGGWLVFNNLILPLLRGPAMLVGWMLQISHSLINDLPALDSEDANARNQAWIDVLLNIGLVLLHVAREHGAVDTPLSDRMGKELPVALDPLRRPLRQSSLNTETAITQETPGLPSEPPGSGDTLLDFNLSTARDSASARLFNKLLEVKVPWPESLPEPIATGPFKGLYRIRGLWHATLAGLLFRVSIAPGFGEVYLVHPEHPDHPGIKLRSNGDGKWTLDQGLKLLGGGPKSRIAAKREQDQQRIDLLELNRREFFEQQERVQKRVDIAENLMQLKRNHPASTETERATFRQRFAIELDRQSESYVTQIAEIKEISTLKKTDPDNQLLCNLLENIINNARKQVVIADLDRAANSRNYADLSGGVRQLYEALNAEGLVVMDRYFDYVRKTSEINETMIKFYEEVDRRLQELKQIPRLGAEPWSRLSQNRPENEMTALRVKSYQLVILRILSVKALGTETSAALESVVDPVLLLSRSHAELQGLHVYERGDRIEVLDNLVDHYNKAQDGLESIGIFNSDDLQSPAFNRLREIIEQLRVDAERRLAEELQNLPQPEEPSPSPSTSRKKVIKTAKGTLIGDIRPRISNQGGDIVDINGPLEDEPLASFHEHEPNVWVEIVDVRPPAPKASSRPYPQLKGDARKAMVNVDKQVKKIDGYAQRASSPKEIEEQLQREAQKLVGYADNLERHENAPSNREQDAALVSELRDKARALDNKATELRTRMTLAQAPTSEGVEYLLRRNEIYVHVSGNRVQLKTGRRDFMQEYVLLHRDSQAWWYGHFHYANFTDAKTDYTQAHLKTKEQRFETYESALAKAKDPKQKIDIHRGFISKALADSDFLPLEPR